MNRRPVPTRGGLEFETFCRCRQCKLSLNSVARRFAKRAYWKRARRVGAREIHAEAVLRGPVTG